MTEQSNLDLLRRWNDAHMGDDLEAALQTIDQIFDPEVEFSPLLAREVESRTYHGHEGVREFFRDLNDMLGGVSYGPGEYEQLSDDVILLAFEMTGTGRGSSVPLSQELFLVYEFRRGLVRRFTAYGSREEALKAARRAVHA